jgi:hypothetical protein
LCRCEGGASEGAEAPGKGVSDRLVDRAFWLPYEYDDWFLALEAIDQRDDPAPLLALLKPLVPAAVYPHLVDLFTRKKLRRVGKRGVHPTPSYDRTVVEAKLDWAKEDYDELVAGGKDEESARREVARKHKIVRSTLDHRLDNTRGSTSRMKKRRGG